jgi:hypothetical protein
MLFALVTACHITPTVAHSSSFQICRKSLSDHGQLLRSQVNAGRSGKLLKLILRFFLYVFVKNETLNLLELY